MSGSVDYANAHAYVSTSLTPSSSIAATLSAVMTAAPGKPVVITETGYTTQANTQYLGVNETVQAKSILNTLVDAYKAGVSATYLYELFDRELLREQYRSGSQFRPVQLRRHAEARRDGDLQPDDHSG